MKTVYALLITIFPVLLIPAISRASASAPADEGAPVCYGYAVVGYDMVIDARLGVPPDLAIGLAAKAPGTGTDRQYSIPVLKLVLGAYGWQGAPEDYAAQVMNYCVQNSGGRSFEDEG